MDAMVMNMAEPTQQNSHKKLLTNNNNNNKCHILFIHGLESGPKGSKARYLINHFGKEICTVPNMEMSVFNIFRRNSIIRRRSFSSSMDSCVEIILETIKTKKLGETSEYILLGSSWGGAVALHVMKRLGKRNQPKKTILIAPALSVNGLASRFFPTFDSERLLRVEGENTETKTSTEDNKNIGTEKILIFHGTADDIIPIQSSRDFAAKFPKHVKLIEVGAGDHRLNGFLLEPTVQHPHGRLKSYLVEAGATEKQ